MSPTLITVDTTSTLETVLAFLGPPVGVIIGAGATRLTIRNSARDAQQSANRIELQRALARYIAATELVAIEILSLPASSWIERQADRIPRRRIGFFFNSVAARMVFGRRHDDLRAEYQRARADVVLIGPIEIIGLTMKVDEFFVEWEARRTRDFQQRWSALRDEIRLIAQRTVDEGRGRAYRAGETQSIDA